MAQSVNSETADSAVNYDPGPDYPELYSASDVPLSLKKLKAKQRTRLRKISAEGYWSSIRSKLLDLVSKRRFGTGT